VGSASECFGGFAKARTFGGSLAAQSLSGVGLKIVIGLAGLSADNSY
jgi:hypothetical protein